MADGSVSSAARRGAATRPKRTSIAARDASTRPAEAQAADVAIGVRVRTLRRVKGLRLEDMARRMGVSIGYLSQIERGLSSPSLRVLVKLSDVLEAPLGDLFPAPDPPTPYGASPVVVRAAERAELLFWRAGVTKQLLTAAGGGALSMVVIDFAPGAGSGEELYSHCGEEAGLVLDGAVELTLETQSWSLAVGDSFRFRSERPHRFVNRGDRPARVLWVNVDPRRGG